MNGYEIALARAPRITSTRVAVIMTGSYKLWNSLAETLRKSEPAPIGQRSGIPATDWGHKHEPMACGEFWFRHPEYQVEDEPFRYWYDPADKVHWDLCSTSPDRTLYQKGEFVSGIEAKCPYTPDIHRQYWSDGVVPEIYRPQVYWHMVVTDAQYWWFVSFDPREKAGVNYWELKVERDRTYEAEMLGKVDRFIGGYLAGETFAAPKYDYSSIF